MTRRVGTRGEIVIPKALRDQAGLHPGTEVEFEENVGSITLKRVTKERRLGGFLPGSDMAAALLKDRRREPK